MHTKNITNSDGTSQIVEQTSDISDVLKVSPNNYQSPTPFWTRVICQMLEDGYTAVVPIYQANSLQALVIADGINQIEHGLVDICINGNNQLFNISDVLIFENPNKNLSIQLGQISDLINQALISLSHKLSDDGSKLKGLLQIPTRTNDSELLARANKRIETIMASAANSEIGVLELGEEFQELSNEYGTASEDELESLKRLLTDAFGINENLISGDFTEIQYRAYRMNILNPFKRVITEELNRKLFTKTARTQGHSISANYNLWELATLSETANAAQALINAEVMSPNEIRQKMLDDLSPYVNGDIIMNRNQVSRFDEDVGESEESDENQNVQD
jgi:HK97 family phage portal protein